MGFVLPAGQAWPGKHGPLQLLEVTPVELPKRPALQLLQAAAAAGLNCPTRHTMVRGEMDPAGHACPALQLPLQADDVRPEVLPNVPGSQGPLQVAVARPWVAP